MKTIFFGVLLMIFIMVLSNAAVMIERSNGIPDVFSKVLPEHFSDEKTKEDAQAMNTGMAPFAKAENAAQPAMIDPAIEYKPLGEAVAVSEELHLPHRPELAVNEWVTEAVSKILTFGLENYSTHQQELTKLMTPAAIKELNEFLKTTNIFGLMQGQNYELRSFVSDVPKLVTAGVAAGRYRWAYDVPVSLTFLPVGNANYDKLDEDDYRFEELNFRMQVGRVPEGGSEGMLIETWEVLKRKRKEG